MSLQTNIKFGLAALTMGLFVLTSCSKDELEAPKANSQATSDVVVSGDENGEFIQKAGGSTSGIQHVRVKKVTSANGLNDIVIGGDETDLIGDADDSGTLGNKDVKKVKPKVVKPLN